MGLWYATQINSYDNVHLYQEDMWKCQWGAQVCSIWQTQIDNVAAYDPYYFVLEFEGSGPIWGINRVMALNVESINYNPSYTYLVYFHSANDTANIAQTVASGFSLFIL